MNVREKLVEILRKPIFPHELVDPIEAVADYLLDSGVTVQEWISVKDRLPEHGDVVLCFMKFGEHRILQWDNVSSWWLGYGQGDDWQKSDVTHWSKMPQPPKGE